VIFARGQFPGRKPVWRALLDERADANTLLKVFEVEVPPVDVEMIARRMEIDLAVEMDPNISGRLSFGASTGRPVIFVRRDHVPWRQRFTIAHEIGHLLLGHAAHGRTCYRGFNSGTPEESAANRFAADLLMPLWMLEPLVLRHGSDVSYLARAFSVSDDAMNIRLGILLNGPRR
jgi:hypothetical protein